MIDHRGVRRGFTLVELLVVIGIIGLLVGILLPIVSKVRISGHIADTKNWMNEIQGSIERYYTDFHAYPGPIPNNNINDPGFLTSQTQYSNFAPTPVAATAAPGFDVTPADFNTASITGSENLVLGLLGGLNIVSGTIYYDPTQVGLGPMNLNSANPKRYPKYLDPTNLSWQTNPFNGLKTGRYFDDSAPMTSATVGGANDSIIPEFLDRFPDTMPILYLRCKKGVDPILPNSLNYGPKSNSVITFDITYNSTSSGSRVGPFDLSQIIAYTGANPPIGVGRNISRSDCVPAVPNPTPLPHGLQNVTTSATSSASMNKADSAYQYPYDAFPYFENPANVRGVNATKTGTEVELPRQKDSYILIAPGKDRTYGTDDDICNFGDVKP